MKKRNILFLILALMLAIGMIAGAQASVTTAESGPVVGKHTAQSYVFDIKTNVITNAATGEQVSNNGLKGLRLLYPGDTIEFRSGGLPEGYVFEVNGSDSVASVPGKDGKTHVEVLETASYPCEDGSGKPLSPVPVITKVKIVGDELVLMRGGYYHTFFTTNHEYGGIHGMKYTYIPMWCNITTESWFEANSDHHQMSGSELATAAYYTSEGSSSRAWAEDSMANGYGETHREVLLTLRRPYIEGRYFTGVNFSSASGKNQISKVYSILEGTNWHGNFWEGWMDNQVEIHPQLTTTNNGEDYGGYGAYDEELLVRFKYNYGRTVTFDACGGTIDGYASRIYEAEGRQYFNQELKEGKVDEDFAAGKAYVPVREGYSFGGWYEDAAYTTPVTSIKDTVAKYDEGTSNPNLNQICRLYAKWLSCASLDECKLEKIKDQTYTGKAIEPKLTLTFQGETLEKGKDYTVTFKNNVKIGKASVAVTGKGRFSGTKNASFLIVPKKVSLSKLKAGEGSLTVKWKKGSNIDGYEIQYSLKKDFKSAKKVTVSKAKTTEYQIKKLKSKKTYYVRIRTFKKAGGKTYYSEWSKALSKKVK